MSDKLKKDLLEILGSGINHTGQVMDMLKERGWSNEMIVPVIYQLLLQGKVDPKGNRTPYKAN